jgi:hypothetical protein
LREKDAFLNMCIYVTLKKKSQKKKLFSGRYFSWIRRKKWFLWHNYGHGMVPAISFLHERMERRGT